ncbi:restriction endonuclease subunit S [Flavobacterium inviolabile]|uniref:restriction endonuclease subunit S n=1 Tax=Flavobacterium inviolabile TaxID=2748320 RepID=UPI0015AC416A|nr:restriction endonuclease subunit S [Flavobacterium inviolabile]
MITANFNYLNFIPFTNFDLWDTKRYTSKSISSTYPIVSLGSCVKEENKKYKLFLEEEKDFGILGVNNKEGIFDAYIQKGKEINQPYKKMEVGWLAYNPYRINVGSIGVRKEEHKHEYISPAYVVFSCLESLLPEYLFLLFKTNIFNKVINENTTGSVRQNLTIEILRKLEIPLPSLEEQEQIVRTYYDKIKQAEQLEEQAKSLEKEIELYFLKQLGLNPIEIKSKIKGLFTIDFNDLERWDYFSSDVRIADELKKSVFPLVKIGATYFFEKRPFNKNVYKQETFKYIEIGAIDPIKGIVEAKEIKTNKAPSRATQFVKEGDLILGTTRPYLKKFTIVTKEYDNNVCSSGFSVIRQSENYYLPYLLQFLRCSYGIEQLKNRMTGGLYPAITEGELKEIKIPFPDVDNQIAIMQSVKQKEDSILKNQSKISALKQQAEQEFEKTIFN